jgi:hypothetical protein
MIYSQTDIILQPHNSDETILKNLKFLKPGDNVLTFNLQSKEIELNPILNIAKKTVTEAVVLNSFGINNFVITPDTYILSHSNKFILSNSYTKNHFVKVNQQLRKFERIYKKDKYELSMDLGFLVGYWLSCSKTNERYVTFKEPIEYKVKKTINHLNLSIMEKDDSVIIIDDYFKSWVTDFFVLDKIKYFANWVINSCDDFTHGLLYGLINNSSNIQLFQDKNVSICYLTLFSKKLAYDIVKLLNIRYNIHSYVITDKNPDNELKFKVSIRITPTFFDLLNIGRIKGYYEYEEFEKINKFVTNSSSKNIKKINGHDLEVLDILRADSTSNEHEMIQVTTESNQPIILANGLIVQ